MVDCWHAASTSEERPLSTRKITPTCSPLANGTVHDPVYIGAYYPEWVDELTGL